MTRPTSPFAAPPPKKAKLGKRDIAAELAEKAYVRQRDRGCVANRALNDALPRPKLFPSEPLRCDGPIDVDHVRASGGLGLKSETHRTNLVSLCRHHHRLKTEFGKTWRPLLLEYLARVEGEAA